MCLHSGNTPALLAFDGIDPRLYLLGAISAFSSSEQVNVAESAVLVSRDRVGLCTQ